MLLKIGIMGCLVMLFYQDMRYRAVYWVIFPVLFLLLGLPALKQYPKSDIITRGLINLAFLFLQLLLLSSYFSLKHKKWINITSSYLGWGDILFLLAITFFLSPLNYILFYTLSLLAVLCFSPLFYAGLDKSSTIPLAGLQAMLFAGCLTVDWNSVQFNLQSDNWLLQYLIL